MFPTMNIRVTRRNLLQSFTMLAAGAASGAGAALVGGPPVRAQAVAASGKPSPIRLGLTSSTFRTFSRAQFIAYMEQFNVLFLSCSNIQDHLPMDPTEETQALADYASAGILLHAAGPIAFTTDAEFDVRGKFDYAKRAGINLIVADPTPATLPIIDKLVREYDIRVAVRNRVDSFNFPSPFDVLKAIKSLDQRIGCCIDTGATARANANVVEAIHAADKRLYNVQVNDLASLAPNAKQVAVGRGVLPVREIFAALIAIDFPDFVDLAYEIDPNNPITGVAESLAYMRGVLDGMGYLARTAG
jgi:sugar phosphate isomerase/epimerase